MTNAQMKIYNIRESYEIALDGYTPGSPAYRKLVAFIKGTGLQVLRHKTTGKHKIAPPKE